MNLPTPEINLAFCYTLSFSLLSFVLAKFARKIKGVRKEIE